jgi:hypothetical protein
MIVRNRQKHLVRHGVAETVFVANLLGSMCSKLPYACPLTLVCYCVICYCCLQVDAAEDMWGSAAGRSAGGSKMLLEDADADEDDLVVGLGAAAGAAADFMAAGSDTGGATAMDAAS